MADTNDEIQAALAEAQRAREEADRIRKTAREESDRLRDEARRARDEARRLRDEAREQSRRTRGHRSESRPFHSDDIESTPGVRSEHAIGLEGIESVQIDQTAGKLTVRACKEGETPGVTSISNKNTPEIHVHQEGSKLSIDVKLSKGWLFRRRQGAATVVRLDERAFKQVKIDNGYGETEVQAIAADDLRIHVGAGMVQCILTRGSLDVNLGAGKMSVLSHSGLARCDSGTGDVLLDIAELDSGEYKVDVGIGRAEVRFPEGGAIHINTSSGIGKSRIEYPSAPAGAATSLRLNSGIGECIVKARDVNAGQGQKPAAPAGQAKPQRPSRSGSVSRRREAEEMRVLQMLEQGKISPQDAADLIAALQGSSAPGFDEPDDEDGGVFRA
ncbi:MAG: DUF4097 family beta strand repeat-containing protein [Dehalococcoidia bacterium]